MSPIAARNVAAQITLTPGTVISRRISGESSAWRAISRSTAAISLSRNSTWRMPGVDRLALLERQLEPGQPRAALDAEQVRAPAACPAAGASAPRGSRSWRASARAPAARAAPAGGATPGCAHRASRPRRARPAANSLRQRARVEPVGLRARLADPGVVRAHHDHPRDVRLEDPRDLPALPSTSNATRSSAQALRKQLQPLRRGRDPTGRTHATVLDDRDLAEIQVHIQPDRPPHRSPPRLRTLTAGEPAGKRHRRDTRSRHNRASRRGGHRKARARSPSSKTACPTCVLPESPCPGRPTVTAEPRTAALKRQFHAPSSRSAIRPVGVDAVHRHYVGVCQVQTGRAFPRERVAPEITQTWGSPARKAANC